LSGSLAAPSKLFLEEFLARLIALKRNVDNAVDESALTSEEVVAKNEI